MSNTWLLMLSLSVLGCAAPNNDEANSLCLGEVFTRSTASTPDPSQSNYLLGGDVLYTVELIGDQGRRQLLRQEEGVTVAIDSGSVLDLIDADDTSVLYVVRGQGTSKMIRAYLDDRSTVVAEESLPVGTSQGPYLSDTLIAWKSGRAAFVFDGEALHTLGNGDTTRIAIAENRVIWAQSEGEESAVLEWKAGTTRELTRLSEEISSLSATDEVAYIAMNDEVLAHRDSSGLTPIFQGECEAPVLAASDLRVAINCDYGHALYSIAGSEVQVLDTYPRKVNLEGIESVRVTGNRIAWSRMKWDGQETHSTGEVRVSALQGDVGKIVNTGSRCMVCAQVEASRAVDISENWMAWNYNPREAGPGAQGESLAYAPLVQCNN